MATLIWLGVAGVAALANHQPGHNSANDTRSYYVGNKSTSQMQDLGCTVGAAGRNGIMTLFYGSPTDVNGVKGATRFGSPVPLTGTLSVSNLTKYFALGYVQCSPSGRFLYVGVATNNCSLGGGASRSGCTGSKTSTWAGQHGTEWAQMVNGIGTWISQNGYSSKVAVRAAYDAEPSWSNFSQSENWLHGYDSANSYPLIANYSADGCPTTRVYNSTTNYACSNGWNLGNLWHEARQHSFVLALPQIYTTSGTQAVEWMRISEWGYHAASTRIIFEGPLTQNGACQDTGGCPGKDNTASQGWSQLRSELNAHSHVNQSSINYTSDVRWAFLN